MSKDLPKPEKGKKPKKITTEKKPGSTGPGGETPARDRVIKRSPNRKGKLTK